MARLTLLDQLRIAGIGSFNAQMSIPYMNMLPRTCEPSAQGVSQLVTGLQNLLVARGADLEVNGIFGDDTLRAVIPYAGARWYNRTWSELYNDVIKGKSRTGMKLSRFGAEMLPVPSSVAVPAATGDVIGSVTDFATSPVGLVAIGAVVAWKMGLFKRLR
jgi:hypothetical protein